jgi:hypothetical protein
VNAGDGALVACGAWLACLFGDWPDDWMLTREMPFPLIVLERRPSIHNLLSRVAENDELKSIA